MNEGKNERFIPFLEGKLIALCPLNMEHANLYTKWSNDPDVRRYSRHIIPWSLDEEKKWIEPREERVKKEIIFEILHRQDNKPIGTAGFSDINWYNRNANIFAEIGETNYWGKGIGPETIRLLINYGFEELNFHKIYSRIHSPNKQSLRVAEKTGFVFEGELKEHFYIDGEFVDEQQFAIFKKTWLESKKG
ncbi:MAG: GNAT family N-acetyltransferase [Candidatus Odinarchaeota archaeon]